MSITSRDKLIAKLNTYKTAFAEEAGFVNQFLDLLRAPRCYFRDHLPGHLTGSSWIVNESGSDVLLVHHAKLNKWLQPGGHADGDENIYGVALREAMEETGLKTVSPITEEIFDIDIHPIPPRADFQQHLHFDVRFIFQASQNEVLQVSAESNHVAWFNLDKVASHTENNTSILRMMDKTKQLLRSHQH
ncbi:MAG TPA: NUDIX hydrolase [Cyclobacteriaceae bacterium]|nr:NUDIX hydrolase [Cyclobacteriaceae bacterium]HRJ82182.1 NUDIX hydrolase [Cyclobacteriaceae bacterium]